MKALIQQQLQHSINTMQAVRDDEQLNEAVLRAAELTANALKNGNKLMVAGNGGSAADAQHLVAEFVARLTVDRPALAALALTTDTSILTAVSNDHSYDNIFERQIEALGRPGDVFLAISTSGNAKSIVKALHMARRMGIHTVGYTGNGGGLAGPLCDICVIVPSKVTMQIQECHLALEHILCMLVERLCFGMDFDKEPSQIIR